MPLLQRELATAILFKTQREQPKSKRQLLATGALGSRDAKRQIKDRAARERLTAYRREQKKAEKLATQQREEQEILEKGKLGEIPPPNNPVDQLFWFNSVVDPFV